MSGVTETVTMRMRRLYRWSMAMIVLSWVVWGLPAGLYAQSKTAKEKPVIQQRTIQETDLSDKDSPDSAGREGEDQKTGGSQEGSVQLDARDIPDELPENSGEDVMPEGSNSAAELPLLAKITPKTTPQRAASLKLIEEGRKSLAAGEYKQALATFERAIAVDATNPYSHYFVARAHFFLGNYEESFNFLDVAESLLGWHKRWMAAIYVLKGRNDTAMGFLGRADTDYLDALAFDPYNRFAIERLTTISEVPENPTPAP